MSSLTKPTTNGHTEAISSSGSSTEIPRQLYLVGINVMHSIAPPMHNYIAQQTLSLPWTFSARECPTISSVIDLLRDSRTFGGAVVTMPYKVSVMGHLDGLDDLATRLGACNCVYRTPEGQLRGTNTDWRGVKGCLVSADEAGIGRGKPACVVGAGGASRAAVYALAIELGCSPVYIVNRDEDEVASLTKDVERMAGPGANVEVGASGGPQIVHVRSVEQARKLVTNATPFYIVGTVPDFEPTTPSEIMARSILETFFACRTDGVFLDMCFKPRVTRQIKLARRYGWAVVEGTEIIGHQIGEQYRLWAGKTLSLEDQQRAWKVLRSEAERSPGINF